MTSRLRTARPDRELLAAAERRLADDDAFRGQVDAAVRSSLEAYPPLFGLEAESAREVATTAVMIALHRRECARPSD